MASTPLPPNVHVSSHPCLQAKLSQLRSNNCTARETKLLVHEIAILLGCDALAHALKPKSVGSVYAPLSETLSPSSLYVQAKTPLGYDYTPSTVSPSKIAIIPILRSGLGMLDAIQLLLPEPVPVHHLGLFREPTTLEPVEYYNNLPYEHPPGSGDTNLAAAELAILVDPVIATGGTCAAAIQTLREWGVQRVVVVSVLGSEAGLARAATEWEDGVEVWVGGVDPQCDAKGMIKPGLGDVGDRLFLTLGK